MKIVSGGQTGADRAALDFAIERGMPHGGWCPKGRRAEDGLIDAGYRLKETPSENYAQRTEWNVRDSDATLIFSLGAELEGGSQLTADLARDYRRPWAHIHPEDVGALATFLGDAPQIRVLNIAGSREDREPGIYEFTKRLLQQFLGAGRWVETAHGPEPQWPSPTEGETRTEIDGRWWK